MRLISGVLLAGVALSGCSVRFWGGSGSTVEPGELERQVSSSLAAQVGQTPADMDCPDPLEREVGASTRCTLTAQDGTQFGVTVTVNKVDGDNVSFDAQVDHAPKQ